jgi:serine/threonine-protein kinase
MQYVDGGTLSERADLLSLEHQVQILRDVAGAVHAAHRGGLIHRDLKPGNILLEQRDDGRWHPYVVDFGLAQDQEAAGLTRTGSVTGTPAYLSPEQAQAQPLDRRSDVYSLGVVLYELLCGELPLSGASFADSLLKVVGEAPEPLGKRDPRVPRDLDTIVMKCLEKEPQRRYDSARALALDLQSFLDGEPIQARPPSLAYRAGKWVRKNRAVAGILAAATAVVLALVGYGLRLQWVQAQRAELLQRFSQEVERVESEMRLASLLPRHDMTGHKSGLAARMGRIRQEMQRLGSVAQGPGNYALGRGLLALHDYEAALEHLEQAWRLGYTRPEVAEGLGRTLGVLYQKALLTREAPGDSAEAVEDPIERRYRLPALSYLQEGAAAKGPYAQAMIAFYDRRYEEALARAREAADAEPWFYEARQLEAEIFVEQAAAEVQAGRVEQALALYEQAGQVYGELLAVARSDASVYAAECRRRAEVTAVMMDLRRFSATAAEQALALCDQALAVDPDLAEAYTQKAYVHSRWGTEVGRAGGDPRGQLEAARRMAEAAVERNRREVLAYRHLGTANLTLAAWQGRRGEDPSANFQQAVVALEKAVEIQPAVGQNHHSLGNVFFRLGEWEVTRGWDPRPTVERAVACYRRSLELEPSKAATWAMLGSALVVKAEYEIERGLDPRAAIGEAVSYIRRAVELNPRSARWHNQLGTAVLTQGEYLLRSGADPRGALDLAIASFETALALNPGYDYAHYNIAFAQRSKAQYLLGQGADPSAAVAAVRQATARALALNPQDFEALLELAAAERLAGEWELARGGSPEAFLGAAQQALARGLAANPRFPALHQEEAVLQRSRAAAAGEAGAARTEALRRALAAVDRCLALSPEEAPALALKADLLWRSLPADRRRLPEGQRVAQEAASLLAGALLRNPRLSREYGALAARLEAVRSP